MRITVSRTRSLAKLMGYTLLSVKPRFWSISHDATGEQHVSFTGLEPIWYWLQDRLKADRAQQGSS